MILILDNNTFIDTNKPIDLSIPLRNDQRNPRAWYVGIPKFEPVRTEHYVGSVKEGGSVNFRDIFFNPHGHGTHTECLGHITKEVHSINELLKTHFFTAQLVTVLPKRIERENGEIDFVITTDQVENMEITSEALIVRTLPNEQEKMSKNYSSTNPPYLEVECAQLMLDRGVEHLLIDLPSVDRESDEGVLAFHHAFWEVPQHPNFKRTITELIFVDNKIKDGHYILNLQVAPFHNDASPSRPVIFEINGVKK